MPHPFLLLQLHLTRSIHTLEAIGWVVQIGVHSLQYLSHSHPQDSGVGLLCWTVWLEVQTLVWYVALWRVAIKYQMLVEYSLLIYFLNKTIPFWLHLHFLLCYFCCIKGLYTSPTFGNVRIQNQNIQMVAMSLGKNWCVSWKTIPSFKSLLFSSSIESWSNFTASKTMKKWHNAMDLSSP